jgi:hypothetical protein
MRHIRTFSRNCKPMPGNDTNTDVLLTEIREMESVLRGILRHEQEIHLLVERGNTLCPELSKTGMQNPLRNLLRSDIDLQFHTHSDEITRQLTNLATYKRKVQDDAEKETDR